MTKLQHKSVLTTAAQLDEWLEAIQPVQLDRPMRCHKDTTQESGCGSQGCAPRLLKPSRSKADLLTLQVPNLFGWGRSKPAREERENLQGPAGCPSGTCI